MKEITVKNHSKMEGNTTERDNNKFTVKSVIPIEKANKCSISFVEVEPGNHAYGYHYHEVNEEAFYIISGTGSVRTKNGDVEVHAGDIITFPTGEEGSHVISNSSGTEKLVYIDFGTTSSTEIVHFPDTNKVMVVGPYSHGMYDKN